MSIKEQLYTNNYKTRTFGCEHKRDYGSFERADKVAKGARRKGRSAGVIMAPYRCKICGGWHLTALDELEMKRQRRDKRRKDY